jgi:urease gamma subunit
MIKINAFSRVIFRTPYFPFSTNIAIIDSNQYAEALFLASPDLYMEYSKQTKSNNKLAVSLNKYALRAKSRATPFGLFAGCSVATIGERTEICLTQQSGYRRHTRLDMDYLVSLIEQLEKNSTVRSQLRYYPNNSLYELGGQLRYMEYIVRNNRREFRLTGVEPNKYIRNILENAKEGRTIDQLVNSVSDPEISREEVIEFISELIDSQLLKSEIEIRVTGQDILPDVLKFLHNINGIDKLRNTLHTIASLLDSIDCSPVGSTIPVYEEITELIKQTGVRYNPHFLFQSDLYKPVNTAFVSQETVKDVIAGLNFLNAASSNRFYQTDLARFQQAFQSRYEQQEIPLLEALDGELGIGYPVGTGESGKTPVIKGLVFPSSSGVPAIQIGQWGKKLLKKYMNALKNEEQQIELTDEDIKGLAADWTDFPATFICKFVLINNSQVYIANSGGSSASRILSRFCHLDKEIEHVTKEITTLEESMYPHAVAAEIVHLPSEFRAGNILFRPVLRKYEIPILCKAGAEEGNVIPLTDLFIRIREKRLSIFSRTLGKEVIPYSSSAYNYSLSSNPAYRFLCDLQFLKGQKQLYFSWDGLNHLFDFLPRVIYKNCILSRANWKIKKEDVTKWDKLSDLELLRTANAYRIKNHISEKAVLIEGDNELLIDFSETLCIHSLIDIIRKQGSVIVEEFLHIPEKMPVKDEKGVYCNEFILSLYKENVK